MQLRHNPFCGGKAVVRCLPEFRIAFVNRVTIVQLVAYELHSSRAALVGNHAVHLYYGLQVTRERFTKEGDKLALAFVFPLQLVDLRSYRTIAMIRRLATQLAQEEFIVRCWLVTVNLVTLLLRRVEFGGEFVIGRQAYRDAFDLMPTTV